MNSIKIQACPQHIGTSRLLRPLKLRFGQVIAIVLTFLLALMSPVWSDSTHPSDLGIRPVPLSDDSTLSSLLIDSGSLSPAFSPSVTTYSVIVSSATATMKVTPSVSTPPATLTVNGSAVNSGTASQSIALETGINAITIVVTAPDTFATTSYRLNVTRLQPFNADLSNLTLSEGTLSPSFSSSTTTYTASVATTTSSIQLTATTADGAATMKIKGVSVPSGTPSATIPLVTGANSITVEVNSANLMVARYYQVNITRVPSAIATLSWLSLSEGTMNTPFSSSTTLYSVSVPSDVTWTNVFAAPSDKKATIRINGNLMTEPETSGYTTQLKVGLNTIHILVTAQNLTTTRTYTIKVTRAKPSDATLSGLLLKTAKIQPKFSGAVFSYKGVVAKSKALVKIKPTAKNENDTIQVNGKIVASGKMSQAIPLKIGKNVIKIVVKSDEGTSQTYRITLTRLSTSGSPVNSA